MGDRLVCLTGQHAEASLSAWDRRGLLRASHTLQTSGYSGPEMRTAQNARGGVPSWLAFAGIGDLPGQNRIGSETRPSQIGRARGYGLGTSHAAQVPLMLAAKEFYFLTSIFRFTIYC